MLARWYRPPPVPQGHPALPRIFVSEVIVADLSPPARAVISRYTAASAGVSVGPGKYYPPWHRVTLNSMKQGSMLDDVMSGNV